MASLESSTKHSLEEL